MATSKWGLHLDWRATLLQMQICTPTDVRLKKFLSTDKTYRMQQCGYSYDDYSCLCP